MVVKNQLLAMQTDLHLQDLQDLQEMVVVQLFLVDHRMDCLLPPRLRRDF